MHVQGHIRANDVMPLELQTRLQRSTLAHFKDAALISLLFSKMPQIGVLDHHQRATDKPNRTTKRSVGQMHVRRCAAEWIIKNVLIRMLPVKPIRAIDVTETPRPFIPEHMPSPEIKGVYFEPPANLPNYRPIELQP